ncbi:MAG: hypothetical protein ACYTGO_12440, partial [Planctomycetota bacterium]
MIRAPDSAFVLAPLIFSGIYEYHLLLMACFLLVLVTGCWQALASVGLRLLDLKAGHQPQVDAGITLRRGLVAAGSART